jgi:uncharacterized DUF497 family protein
MTTSLKLSFEWDPWKAAKNLRSHNISFEEAVTSFFDPNASTYPDDSHSSPGDERLVNLGLSAAPRLLFVVHNEEDGRIRIISARRATPAEQATYEED